MLSRLSDAIAQKFQLNELRFDEAGCFSHTLPSHQEVHLRWLDEDSALLVALPLGQMKGDLADVRAFLLLVANQTVYLTGGGAMGIDRQTRDVYLSRVFPLNPDTPHLEDALGALMPFCVAGEAARVFFGTVNAMEAGVQMGDITFPEIPTDEAEALLDEIQAADAQDQPPVPNDEYIARYEAFLGDALKGVGFEYDGLDDDLAYYIGTEDSDLSAQIRFDTLMGEIVLTCIIGNHQDDTVVEHAFDLLADNLFLEATGNCALGVSVGEPCAVSLSMAVPMEGLEPDAASFSNLIASFLQNATVWCESLGERIRGRQGPPLPATMPLFV